MKIKTLIICFIFTFLCFTVGTSQSFHKISVHISKQQSKMGIRNKQFADCFYEVRNNIDTLKHLYFINETDTLFFLESIGIESNNFYGQIWDKNKRIGYAYSDKNNIKFYSEKIYTNIICKLIENWDTTSIRNEEKHDSPMMNPRTIYGTRVIVYKKRLKIDCIKFNEFFILDRDR
jgi:hypothetical protein